MNANLLRLTALLKKVSEFNRNEDLDNGVLRPQILHQNPGLIDHDYAELGDWMLQQSTLTYKDLQGKLSTMRKQRCARWHVYSSPDDVVIKSKSVSLMSSAFLCLFINSCDVSSCTDMRLQRMRSPYNS